MNSNDPNNVSTGEMIVSWAGNLPKVLSPLIPLLGAEKAMIAQSLILGLEAAVAVRQDLRRKRTEAVLAGLVDEVQRLGKEKLDSDFYRSASFLEMVERSMDVCKNDTSDANVEEALRVLRSAVKTEVIAPGAREYMCALAELSESELNLLKTLYRMQKGHPYSVASGDDSWYEKVRWQDLLKETGLQSSEHVYFMLNRISKTGFIIQNSPRNMGEVSEKSATFRITQTLEILMHSLEDKS